jgi:type I restriction enzyme S subunit
MSDELPEGWTSARFGDLLLDAQNGCGVRSGRGEPTVVLRLADVATNGQIARSGLRKISLPSELRRKYALRSGDLIAFRVNGSANIVGQIICYKGDPGYAYCDHFIRFRSDPAALDPSFVSYAFRAADVRAQVEAYIVSSAGQNTISQASLRDVTLSLPALPEQRRIVAKLETLTAEIDASRGHLEKLSDILKRFRQSVLAAACSGQLTKEWRTAEGESDNWTNVRLADVGSVTGGITKNPKRTSLAKQVPYLRVANVYENRLDLTSVLKIGVTSDEYQRAVLREGDLLFVEGNGSIDQIGRVAVWDGSIQNCVHQNHLIRFRASEGLLPHYALIWMMAPQGRQQLIDQAVSSAGLHSLSISKVAAVDLKLTSLGEQREIVRRVDALFVLADEIDKQVRAAGSRTDRLGQAILAKALRGELVPTEAELARQEGRDYESASVLLERIRRDSAKGAEPRSRVTLKTGSVR